MFWTKDTFINGWDIKTYKDISDSIISTQFTNNKYYLELIEDYKQLTLNLSQLASSLKVSENYDFAFSWNKPLYNKLNEIKLWEVYQKLRASHLLNHLQINHKNIKSSYSINRQKATMDFPIELSKVYEIGIQLEDNQLRRYVSGGLIDNFANNLKNKGVFFNNIFLQRRNKYFCSYKPAFRYQYEKLQQITFAELFEKIKNGIDEIISLKMPLVIVSPNSRK